MKKILLTTTAFVMTAGVAAADVTFSGSAELTYGNWDSEGVGAEGWGATTDLGVSMSGEANGVAYTAGLTIDETDDDSGDGNSDIAGVLSLSASGLSLSYEKGGEMDAGESDDETGDLKIAYAGSGVSITYVENVDGAETSTTRGANKLDLGYTMGDFIVGYSTNSTDKTTGGSQVNTISATFAAGDLTIKVSGDDGTIVGNTDANWDASVGYVVGASTVTLATDEASETAISVSTSLNDVTLTAKAKDNDNELSVDYTMGDITMSYVYDEGIGVVPADDDGDDAQTIISISYDLGGIKLTGQTNNQDEVEVSAAFTF
jgi:outer membrane protein OmpU